MLCVDVAEPSSDREGVVRVEAFGPDRRDDFRRLHSSANGAARCRCVAWWVPTWEGWGLRSAEENAGLREALCDGGVYDGLLAYAGREPVGWCQVGPRDRLPKLVRELALEPDADVWAVTCLLVAPSWRRRGVARDLVAAAIDHARAAGAARLEAYPRRVADDPAEMWTGPVLLYEQAGFVVAGGSERRHVVSLELPRP
jgi:GNAT superfamily N-acetyltransferase